MTKARQDAMIRKIERSVQKLLPKPEVSIAVSGYDDEMGDNIRDLESDPEEGGENQGKENQGKENQGKENQGEENQGKENQGKENQGEGN